MRFYELTRGMLTLQMNSSNAKGRRVRSPFRVAQLKQYFASCSYPYFNFSTFFLNHGVLSSDAQVRGTEAMLKFRSIPENIKLFVSFAMF